MRNRFNITAKTVLVGITILTMVSFTGCSNKSNTSQNQTGTNNQPTIGAGTTSNGTGDLDGDGLPDTIEKTYGTNPYLADTDGDGTNDKDDKAPVFTDNLISETSTTPVTITIKDARVEDNATADHLEITLTNNGTAVLNNFDIYYTITDKKDNTKEAYYQVLNGLSLNPGDTTTIHFDNQVTEAGHYYGNMSGLYSTSANGLTFAIQLHAKGFQPIDFNVDKAEGTAEVAD